MLRNPQILLVDENTAVRQALEQAIRSEHFQVVPAASGSEALTKLRENQIDVALIDLNQRYSESGWDVFHALTELVPLLPIIVMSGQPDSFADTSASTAAARLEKPLNLSHLFCILDDLTQARVTQSNLNEPSSQSSQ
jgi:DNA-binding NtrC family response regulator